jgi:putative ABC transport system permease protein
MFWKLVREPFRRARSRRRALWAVLAIALGTAVAAAMLSVSLDVGDRVGNELRSLGANIVISPAADSLPVEIGGIDYRPVSEGAYLSESSLPKLKQIFWRNNILAFAPYLPVPARAEAGSRFLPTTVIGTWFDYPVVREQGEEFRTGIRALNPTWKLQGELPLDMEASPPSGSLDAMVGRSLAERLGLRLGDSLSVSLTKRAAGNDSSPPARELHVRAILSTGGPEDEQIFAPLDAVQTWANLPDKVRTVQVSALIKPEDELSRKGSARMTPAERERWYCSPYISSIVQQIGEALPGSASRAVRSVAETQGNVLSKLTFLMGLLAIVALVAAGLSIASLASLTVLERREEIGLMKALGAEGWLVTGLFFTEMTLESLGGGLAGFAGGVLLAKFLGQAVFATTVAIHWLVLPVALLAGLAVSLAGMWLPVRRAVRENPAHVLRSA